MRISYSHDVDAIYIRFSEEEISNSDTSGEDIVMDYNKKGELVAIEILHASKKTEMNNIIVQSFNNVTVENRKTA
jgi:uncharacterized protein YuzE